MTKCGRTLLVALLVGACAGTGSESASRAQPLDGSKFAVSLVPDGQSAMKDELIFSDGKFESTVCTRAGFEKATYATRLVAGGVAFDAQCDSPESGHNEWHGVAQGDHISGTVVRTPKGGGTLISSTFSGDRER